MIHVLCIEDDFFVLLFCRTYWNSKESRAGTNKKQQRITQVQRDLVLSLYFICPDRVDHRYRKWTDDHMSLSTSLLYHIYLLRQGRWEILKVMRWSSELEQPHYFTNSSSDALALSSDSTHGCNSVQDKFAIAIYLVTLIIQQMHKPCHIWPTVNSRFQPNARLGEILF